MCRKKEKANQFSYTFMILANGITFSFVLAIGLWSTTSSGQSSMKLTLSSKRTLSEVVSSPLKRLLFSLSWKVTIDEIYVHPSFFLKNKNVAKFQLLILAVPVCQTTAFCFLEIFCRQSNSLHHLPTDSSQVKGTFARISRSKKEEGFFCVFKRLEI